MRNILLVIILSFLVVGCATSYQPKSYTGGFEDINLGQGKHEITFFGNGYTQKNKMQYYTKKRSGELCVDGFNILKEDFSAPGFMQNGWRTLATTIECKIK